MERRISRTNLNEYSDKNEPALPALTISTSLTKISRKIAAYPKLEPSFEGKDERSTETGEKVARVQQYKSGNEWFTVTFKINVDWVQKLTAEGNLKDKKVVESLQGIGRKSGESLSTDYCMSRRVIES